MRGLASLGLNPPEASLKRLSQMCQKYLKNTRVKFFIFYIKKEKRRGGRDFWSRGCELHELGLPPSLVLRHAGRFLSF